MGPAGGPPSVGPRPSTSSALQGSVPDVDETRVVLVKPGDVLLVGNVGSHADPEFAQPFAQFLRDVGVVAVVFSEDIDVDKIAMVDLVRLARKREVDA